MKRCQSAKRPLPREKRHDVPATAIGVFVLLVACRPGGAENDSHTGTSSDGDGDGDGPSSARVVQVAAGSLHVCALLETGDVKCWGSASQGLLGTGSTEDVGDDEAPASGENVNLGERATQVACGTGHSCALLQSGAVRCWGDNFSGVLGLGHTEDVGDDERPIDVSPIVFEAPVVQIASGGVSNCALLTDGRVFCWGWGAHGELGHGDTESIGDDELPSDAGPVNLGGTVLQLAAGISSTCALLESGAVRCWGSGEFGRLGYGNTETIGDDELPSSVGFVDVGGTVTRLAAGGGSTCALLASRGVRCWGDGLNGKLGYGILEDIGDDEVPSSAGDVDLGGPVADIAVGGVHTCALLESGETRCWGLGESGQLGYGNTETIGDDELPSEVGPVEIGGAVLDLSLGNTLACAIVDEGHLRCWGANWAGQLGYGHTEDIGDDELPSSAGDVEL